MHREFASGDGEAEQAEHKGAEDDVDGDEVALVDGGGEPGVAAAVGREVAAVFAEVGVFGRMGIGEVALGVGEGLAGAGLGRDGSVGGRVGLAALDAVEPAAPVGAEVAAAGDGGQVVHLGEELEFGEALENAEAEGRAADAAAGKGEAGGVRRELIRALGHGRDDGGGDAARRRVFTCRVGAQDGGAAFAKRVEFALLQGHGINPAGITSGRGRSGPGRKIAHKCIAK